MTVSEQQLAAIIASLNAKAAAPHCRREGCTIPLDPVLIDDPTNRTGLHPMCDDVALSEQQNYEAILAEAPPPSTVAEVGAVLKAHEAASARSLQVEVGPSELGTPCQRQLAYRLAGVTKQHDPRIPWAPIQGTAVHAHMENVLRWHNNQLGWERWIVEQELWPDPTCKGHGDMYDNQLALVGDWKHAGNTTLTKARRGHVRPEYTVQGQVYGYGHEKAGRVPRWIRIIFLARSYDYWDSAEYTEPYQPEVAIRALDRMHATVDLINQLDVASNPVLWRAIPAAPSDDTCRWCPFKRPGLPADHTGCPGDPDATQRRIDKFTEGIL